MKTNPWKLLDQYPGPIIRALAALAREKCATCHITGGTIRDWLMGQESRDLDITVASDAFGWAGELVREFGGTFIPMDAEEDVARVMWQEICVDFSSFREGAQTIEEDLLKRDFTFNSMAVPFPMQVPSSWDNVEAPDIIDPAGGLGDLHAKIIRISSPAVFISDPLRMLRAYRFMARLGFRIEPVTEKQIQKHIHLLFLPAEERIAYELDAIMAAEGSIKTIEAMHENGVLEELLPELYMGVGVRQPSSHHLDVFEHGIATLKHMEDVQKDPEKYFPGYGELLCEYLDRQRNRTLLKWAALFHDLGKPETHAIREDRGGRITFYNHDKEGVRIFDIIADRFKWGRNDRDAVARFISTHMWPFHLNNARRKTGLTPKAYLRLIKAVGEDFPGLFMLAMADSLAGRGTGKPPDMEENMADLFKEVEITYRQKIEPLLRERLLTGNDLIEIFGLEPGPKFREIFDSLESAQVEGEVQDREQAIDWVKNYLQP
ncbi:MAG: HD domain-containing protein [Desulfobulbales bacterium]|nr:HD domain-containing protein [Desulfobulbales bacterium]